MRSILYIERKFWEWVSIEKVFRQVAENLSKDLFEHSFQQLAFGSNLQGVLKNLFFFRPRRADLYHITGQVHFIALVLPPAKTILTIHDLRFLHDKQGIKRFVLKKLLLDWPLRRLRYITAISEATRDEIIAATDCAPSKIRVIENPLRDEFAFHEPSPFDRTRPTILQVGTTANKNIPNLIRAISGLDCRLVILGRMDDETTRLLSEHNIDFENKRDLDDAQLVAEYRRADVVAFCSTYEGFGLPIIEAQAVGTPVVTSDLSPMKEVGGDAAILVDPHDTASIRAGIEKLISDDAAREELIRKGRQNVERFKPESIARNYEELYLTILGALE